MQTYCDEESGCRHAQLVMHFGDANTFPGGRCGGGCDNCQRAGGVVDDGDGFDWDQFDAEVRFWLWSRIGFDLDWVGVRIVVMAATTAGVLTASSTMAARSTGSSSTSRFELCQG